MRVRRALALSEQFQDKSFSPILLPFPFHAFLQALLRPASEWFQAQSELH